MCSMECSKPSVVSMGMAELFRCDYFLCLPEVLMFRADFTPRVCNLTLSPCACIAELCQDAPVICAIS